MAVAIPPYRSGKFQVPQSFPMVLPSTILSQSHRTDQGSSKDFEELLEEYAELAKSQSHRTDQGSSKGDRSNRLSLQALKLGLFMTRLESRLCFSFSTAFQLTSSLVTS